MQSTWVIKKRKAWEIIDGFVIELLLLAEHVFRFFSVFSFSFFPCARQENTSRLERLFVGRREISASLHFICTNLGISLSYIVYVVVFLFFWCEKIMSLKIFPTWALGRCFCACPLNSQKSKTFKHLWLNILHVLFFVVLELPWFFFSRWSGVEFSACSFHDQCSVGFSQFFTLPLPTPTPIYTYTCVYLCVNNLYLKRAFWNWNLLARHSFKSNWILVSFCMCVCCEKRGGTYKRSNFLSTSGAFVFILKKKNSSKLFHEHDLFFFPFFVHVFSLFNPYSHLA